jgi:glycosyltransferase AglD
MHQQRESYHRENRTLVIILPVHNEASRLKQNVLDLFGFLDSHDYQATVLIAEDGSSDASLEVAKSLQKDNRNIQILHNDSKLGKGRAIRKALDSAKGDLFVFMDTDLATDLQYLPALLDGLVAGGYDFVTGSRYAPGAQCTRPILRNVVALAYNQIVNRIFRTGISDHQCGFKAFNERAREAVLRLSTENKLTWDTECIVILKTLGMRLGELPVSWEEKKTRSTQMPRLAADIVLQGLATVRIYARQSRWRRVYSSSLSERARIREYS